MLPILLFLNLKYKAKLLGKAEAKKHVEFQEMQQLLYH